MRSLVIEDEPEIGAYLARLLGQLSGIVDVVISISDARQALANFKYDLAIADRMLPDGDALEIVTALSHLPDRPAIIMLTAKDAKEDVSFHAVLELMEDRPFGEWRLHVAKGALGAGEQRVDAQSSSPERSLRLVLSR